MARHELAERPLERRLVEFVRALDYLEERIVQRCRVATVDGEEAGCWPWPACPPLGARLERGNERGLQQASADDPPVYRKLTDG